MALSNIFREPRRELTESAIGLVVFGGVALADYSFATWLENYAGYFPSSGNPHLPWPLGMLIGIGVGIFAVGVLFATHEIGTAICNALQRGGVHLRPRQRR
jgi:hypothetical protein